MYTLTNEQFVQLTRIYNTLLTIETKGENTLIMADCVRALQETLQGAEHNENINAPTEIG